jgi:murein DD-endopeptidase MepM/ murein hydrolase activator NlpD
MRRCLAVLFGVLLLIANASAAVPPGLTAQYQPIHIVNGSPVVFRIASVKPLSNLSGIWLGHELTFSFDSRTKTWFALAGVSLETKPGSYSLQLHAETQRGKDISFEKEVAVGHRRYPRVLVKVPQRYTAPDPEEQAQIAQDKKTKEEVFKTLSAERTWRGSFAPPVRAQISDVFGVQRIFNGSVQSTHQGLDFRVPGGTPVTAVNRGYVILARPMFMEGNFVVVDHGQGLLSLYLHLSKFLVKEGDVVEKGQEIGLSGGTGRATGPHLHLAVRWQGIYLDPKALLALRLP